MHSVSVNVEPDQYLAGWRAEHGALFIPALSEARVGEHAAVRVGIYGQSIRATVFGRISVVRRVGRPALPPGVELQLDRGSLAAAGFLAMAARGEPVTFREREPRFSAERRIGVEHGGVPFETTTLNVSGGGCAVRWPGQLPLVGDVVQLKLAEGFFGTTSKAIVCWNQPGGASERSVGLRIVAAGRAWKGLVKDAAKTATHAA